MKTPYTILLLLFFTQALRLSAQQYNYATNIANLPALTHKNNGSIGLGLSRGSSFSAVDIQGVFSPYPHVAVMVNHFNAVEKDVKSRKVEGSSFYLTEIGVGVYKALPRGSASCMIGYGQGKLLSHYGLGNTATFSIQRLFLQPSIHFVGRYFVSGVGIRLTEVRHSKGNIDYAIDSYALDIIRKIEEGTPFFLPELCWLVGIRIRTVFLTMHSTTIFPEVNYIDFSKTNFGLGLRVNFGKKSEL